MRRRSILSAARVRRLVQLLVLLAFFGLVLATRMHADAEPSPLLKSFFLIDPLVFLATSLAARTLLTAALASLAVIVLTVVLGRVFCGWFCPLGTLHDLAGRLFHRLRFRRRHADHWSPRQAVKYYLLAGFAVMAILGCHWVCVFDPIVLLYRSTATAIAPAAQWAVEGPSTAIFQSDPGFRSWRLKSVTDPPHVFLRDNVFVVPHQAFVGGGLILLVLVGLLLLNAYRPRFWCRYLCPLGALLGVLAWRPLLRRKVQEDRCNQCDLCSRKCHGAASGAAGAEWIPSECLGCMNCAEPCPRESLRFKLVWPWRRRPPVQSVDLSKRHVLAAAVGGVTALYLLRSTPQARGTGVYPDLIRPPGAREEREFLARCTACGMCMKVCPTGGLQPAFTEAGLEGLWTPRLVPQIGYCLHGCNLCGQVCPTEAIEPLELEAKQQVKIGLAMFDTTRCIPYAFGSDCVVCEENCPVPDKAIYTLEVEVQDRDGNRKTIKQPHVDPVRCTGCGNCENMCPYKDRPAVRVMAVNETRNSDNQPVIPNPGPY
jgi:MauM/NapG family ferredoxin protein